MRIYIVRHGQTASNKGDKLLGVTDEGINEFGKLQIKEVSRKLENIDFEICFSSPLKRTLETAEIISNGNIPIVTDDRLLERGFGSLEGGSTNKLYTKDFWNYYVNKTDYGVEPIKNLFCRTKTFLDELKAKYEDKNILVISHAATIRALHFNIVGFDKDTDMLSFKIDNGEILNYNI